MEAIRYEVAGGVGTITLSRPEQRNALNNQMCLDLLSAVKEAEADDAVKVLLVRGSGTAFCAGADLKERDGMTEEQLRQRRLRAFAAYDAIQFCEKPCVAVVHGPTIGSGCEIATACDFIIASESATFRYPEAVRGTVGATQRLPRIVGKAMAKELLFTGRSIDAPEACRIGLVNRVVPENQLDKVVGELCTAIAGAAPLAVRLAKRCVNWGMETDLKTGQAYELLAIDRCLADQEWREGVRAFVEKRQAQF